MPSLQRGSIVWVEITDPQGQNPKYRPAVVVTATEDIPATGTVTVIAVSTQVDQSPPEYSVALPWDRRRHARTGLTERCAAVCNWIAEVDVAAIQSVAGVVPGKQLLQILNILDSL